MIPFILMRMGTAPGSAAIVITAASLHYTISQLQYDA